MDTTNDARSHARHESMQERAPEEDTQNTEDFDIEGALDALPQLDPAEAPRPAEVVAEHLTRLLHGGTPGDGVTAT